jgi:hypothetical protein
VGDKNHEGQTDLYLQCLFSAASEEPLHLLRHLDLCFDASCPAQVLWVWELEQEKIHRSERSRRPSLPSAYYSGAQGSWSESDQNPTGIHVSALLE